MMSRASILLMFVLAACSDPPDPAAPKGAGSPTIMPARPTVSDFIVRSTVVFVAEPTAPHLLEVSYQGDDLCRWSLSRIDDEDADRLIEYRSHGRAFGLLQDQVVSIEYTPQQTQQVFARMALRRLVITDNPAADPWTQRMLPDGLGQVRRESTGTGNERRFTYTRLDHTGQPDEALKVLSRSTLQAGNWPQELELSVRQTTIWTETIEEIQTQGWFAESYFVPPDHSTNLSPK